MDVTDLKEELLLLRKENAELRRTDSAETEGQGEIMTEQRRITDELRSGVANYPFRDNRDFALFEDIADRIDAEHEKAIASVMNDALYHANDKDMADLGFVRLPKDADGEYIHIGDVVVGKEDGEEDFIFEVYEIAFFPDGSCSVRAANDFGFDPWQLHHHKQPTVEDVLRQFLGECESASNLGYDAVPQEVFAEYAAKLQLKED